MNKQMITEKMKGLFENFSRIVKFRRISKPLRGPYSFPLHMKWVIGYGMETKRPVVGSFPAACLAHLSGMLCNLKGFSR